MNRAAGVVADNTGGQVLMAPRCANRLFSRVVDQAEHDAGEDLQGNPARTDEAIRT
jgi:Holliday junction resolvasome RuvABC ATP-dependent DNA helicase subunit